MDREYVENYKGFDIFRTSYGYNVYNGSSLCCEMPLYSMALSVIDSFSKFFGGDYND